MRYVFDVQGGDFSKAGYASSEVKKILKQLNVPMKTIRKVVISLYEAEVNIVAHAVSGVITVDISQDKIIMLLEDKGVGIKDVELAMVAGYSTASPLVREMGFGAGMGLPNIKSNSDILNITSVINQGTKVEIIIFF